MCLANGSFHTTSGQLRSAHHGLNIARSRTPDSEAQWQHPLLLYSSQSESWAGVRVGSRLRGAARPGLQALPPSLSKALLEGGASSLYSVLQRTRASVLH